MSNLRGFTWGENWRQSEKKKKEEKAKIWFDGSIDIDLQNWKHR